jgi:hypothetical protein
MNRRELHWAEWPNAPDPILGPGPHYPGGTDTEGTRGYPARRP